MHKTLSFRLSTYFRKAKTAAIFKVSPALRFTLPMKNRDSCSLQSGLSTKGNLYKNCDAWIIYYSPADFAEN